MEKQFRIRVINHSGRARRLRTDIGDNVIPAGEMAKISVIGPHSVEVYDARDERNVRNAIVPDDYQDDERAPDF